MKGFTVRGIVKLANLVRRRLAGPITPAGLDRLRTHVRDAVEQIDLSLQEQDLQPQAMAPSSRKAYEFLKNVDFDSVATTASAAADGDLGLGSARLPGIKRFCEDAALRIARLPSACGEPSRTDLPDIAARLRRRFDEIRSAMDQHDIRPDQLNDDSRQLLAWLSLMARPDAFDRYVSAVALATAAFEREARRLKRFCPPMTVLFLPGRTIYRLRADGPGTRVILPTPMIAFTDEQFAVLADFALHRGRSEALVVEAMHGPGYQRILAELEDLGSPARPARGVHHDLDVSFNRVNAEYFRGRLERPRLLWGESFTMRKFGHYDSIRDAVMVSSSLDRRDVPAFVVDFIVYHELLHRSMGVAYTNGRRAAHTPDFKRHERAFKLFQQAEAVLAKLGRAR